MSTNNIFRSRSCFSIFLRYVERDILNKCTNCEKLQFVRMKSCKSSTVTTYNCLESPLRQFVHTESKSPGEYSGSDVEDDNTETEEEEDDRTNFPPETDPNLPSWYTDKVVYAIRADQIVGKCLVKSSNAATKLFYEGKLQINNRKLLKKSTKVKNNDIIDIVHEEREKTLVVTRVKVLNLLNSRTKSGKPKTAVRVWKNQFSLDKVKT